MIDTLRPLAAAARRRFTALSTTARGAVVGVVVLPVLALAAIGGDGPETATATLSPTAGSGDTFLAGATALLSHDPQALLDELRDAGPAAPVAIDPAYTAKAVALMDALPKGPDGQPDWSRVDMEAYVKDIEAIGPPPAAPAGDTTPLDVEALDLGDALDVVADRIAAENDETLDRLRDSPQSGQPAVLLAHAATLAAAGDPWGAAANLLVAHEQDEDLAMPLVNLAAIANGQNLPAVSLALLDAADGLTIDADTSPVGIAGRAALLNNRGHALLLLRRFADAEPVLREALALNPELSEAARNLVHALVKLGRDDEAAAIAPRALWRLRGDPAQPVPQRDASDTGPPASPPPPGGSPEQIRRWARAPFLETRDGELQLPLYVALDLSKQGQIAWPAVSYPTADDSYAGWFAGVSADYVATRAQAKAIRDRQGGLMATLAGRRPSIVDTVHQIIEVKATSQSGLEPVDTGMHPLKAWKESLILGSPQLTRFQALDVAQAEWQMEQASDRLSEEFARDSRCPPDSTTEACCAISRRAIAKGIAGMTPFAREYEDQMRVFFRDAYGVSTAIASNLPRGGWHDMARLGIEHDVLQMHARAQQEIAFAFSHAAPSGSGCYGPVSARDGVVPEVVVEAPACSAASQWASGKYAFSDNFSMELTCGKLKFVAEVNVIGTKKLKWGPLNDIGADLGMHAEVEFSMEGTVTIFAGPKAGISGKLGEYGGDFGVKDGIYAVIGADGVRDVGMRVVVGGGVAGGALGGTHDVDSMDFSFVSAI